MPCSLSSDCLGCMFSKALKATPGGFHFVLGKDIQVKKTGRGINVD